MGFVIENNFSPALARAFADSRLKPDLAKAINRIMSQWVSYAMAKIPAGDRSRIKSRLMATASRAKFKVGVVRRTKTGKESSGKRYRELKNSLAAYIVWATNWKTKAFPAGVRQLSADQFYAAVGKYVGARQFSVGYLRSSLKPALNAFRARAGQATRLPQYHGGQGKGEVGSAKPAQPTETILEAEVEGYVEAILDVAPNAFSDSLPEIEATVRAWIAENLAERARREGLQARRV
ncbi:MAG: hypothetical protein E6R03_06700 [Hyphomicrobiaceae bacterium]|nr:MAG: hypothetical protein E6R03_06700 [Hyphomicrobiaceae bacterium]